MGGAQRVEILFGLFQAVDFESEMIEPGVERRWINSRCYREFGTKGVQLPGALPNINPVTCLIGSGPVRDDLFDHLKPEYLKDKE